MGTFKGCLICATWHWKMGKQRNKNFWYIAEVAPHAFLFRWKSMSQNGREVAPHRFLFRRKPMSRHFCWLRSRHIRAAKGIPCVFTSPKGTPHGGTWAKTQAKHKQHTSNTRETCEHHARNMQASHEKHARNMRETCERPTFRLHSSSTTLPFPSAIGILDSKKKVPCIDTNYDMWINLKLRLYSPSLHFYPSSTTASRQPLQRKSACGTST